MTDFELEALWLSARLALFTVLICLPVAMVVASWAGRRRGRMGLQRMQHAHHGRN